MLKKKVSIILPVYNEEASMPFMRTCMEEVADINKGYDWEFLMINDGSHDMSLELMEDYHRNDCRFSYVDLSRNYGKEIAMLAGFDFAKGDAVIVMDADMQHPISVIPEMLKHWEEGFDDVYAQRKVSKEPFFKKNTSKFYYLLLQKFTRIPIQKNTGDFRLLDRSCVDALRRMRESERNTKALYSWVGFKKYGIWYEQGERREGQSKWSFLQLADLAIIGITSYSIAPLRIATLFGVITSFLAFLYGIWVFVKTMVWGDPVAGYPTLMIVLLLLGGVELTCLGIMGEYLGRVFNETKGRPNYFVDSYNGRRFKYE